MNAIEAYISTLENQVKSMPNGYVRETIQICIDLANTYNKLYENNSNITNQPTNQD